MNTKNNDQKDNYYVKTHYSGLLRFTIFKLSKHEWKINIVLTIIITILSFYFIFDWWFFIVPFISFLLFVSMVRLINTFLIGRYEGIRYIWKSVSRKNNKARIDPSERDVDHKDFVIKGVNNNE